MTDPIKQSRPLSRLRPIFGYLLALACLIWVFHDFRFEDFLDHAFKLKWWWVLAAVILDILSYGCQGTRWRLLLRPAVDISVVKATQAIYSGLFLSEVFPMRIGEVARGYLVARWTGARFTSVVPSIVIERVFDGIWLAIGIGLTAMFVPLPRNLLRAGDVFGVTVLAIVVAFLFIVFSRKPNRFTAGIREIGRTRLAYEAFGVSAFIMIIQSCAFWMVMQAYGINLGFWIAAAVLFIVHLGTAIPNAPANVGTYQFFCVVGLTLFGVEKSVAAGFSVMIFAILTIPLWVIGFFALTRSGLTFNSLREEVRRIIAARP